ncbi:hypothetical protein QMT40_002858 [Parvibaculaceae bacterium PLY_AMNH_Bact1]|nr:hypothetical protein QMT40_002858 [Parvibaculaceae bacterium PLY_AMNH_Bact1]
MKLPKQNSAYGNAQLGILAERKSRDLDRLIRSIEADTKEASFHKYADALLFKIYAAYLDGYRLTMTHACNLVPLAHLPSKRKYVVEALNKGLIERHRDPKDRRKLLLEPTEKLISQIEERLKEDAVDLRDTVQRLLSEGRKFPKDNHGLANMDAENFEKEAEESGLNRLLEIPGMSDQENWAAFNNR